jgi:hypothetical protein
MKLAMAEIIQDVRLQKKNFFLINGNMADFFDK